MDFKKTRKQYTESEIFLRLSTLCAAAEYCRADMRRKMLLWDVPEDVQQRILKRLVDERFIDENRYAHAFVRDKFRYNKWGHTRIERELRAKGIGVDAIAEAMEEIGEDESLATLRALISSKRRSVKGRTDYEIRMKLIRFALGRGFDMDDVCKVLSREYEE